MINSLIFEGILVREPEEKCFPNGSKYAVMILGNSQKYTKQDGSITENKCYIEVQVYGKQSEVVIKHLAKGCRVTAQGEINLQSWLDQNGAKKSKHFVVAKKLSILTFKKADESQAPQPQPQQQTPQPQQNIQERIPHNRVEEVDLSHLQSSEITIEESDIPKDLLELANQQTQAPQGEQNV